MAMNAHRLGGALADDVRVADVHVVRIELRVAPVAQPMLQDMRHVGVMYHPEEVDAGGDLARHAAKLFGRARDLPAMCAGSPKTGDPAQA